jgi:hypothetical protein
LFNGYSVPANIFIVGSLSSFLQGSALLAISFTGSPGGNTRNLEFAGYAQDDWKVSKRLTLNYGLRWEYYGRMTERTNKQSMWVADCNCIKRAGIETARGLVDNDLNNFAPRFGLAWRPAEHFVVRASSGIFYDNDARTNLETFSNPPFFSATRYFGPKLANPFSSTGAPSLPSPNAFDEHYRDTYVEQWDLNVQYQPSTNTVVSVAYIGNHSLKGRRLRSVNTSTAVPYSGFDLISLYEQAGTSTYNAFQAHIDRRFFAGLGFTSSYTWGHAIDNRPGQGTGFAQNYNNMNADRGSSDFDVRHTWVSSTTYELPFGEGRKWGGWSVNAINTLRSGRPFTVIATTSSGLRPDLTGINPIPADRGPDNWIDSKAFVAPASGSFGNLGRNTFKGPGLFNLDMSLVKTQNLGERAKMQLRAEFFNILNHPNFTIPSNTLDTNLGKISATSTPERQIQFGIKISY